MTKGLSQFAKFNAEEFLKDKTLQLMKSDVLRDFSTNEHLGAQYTVVVWDDKTKYEKEGISNVGDSYTVKVLDKKPKVITAPVKVKLIEPEGKIFGDFRNQLVLSCRDIQIISPIKHQ